MQHLSGLALVFFLGGGGGQASDALQERLVRLGHSLKRRRTNGRRRFRIVPIAFVILFDNVFEDETVPMAGNGANETRLARVVTEDPADRADGLAQGAVGDDDIAPDTVEDVPAMHGVPAAFDEEHEQIEIAGNQRLFAPVANEHAAARRQDEFAETITGHVVGSVGAYSTELPLRFAAQKRQNVATMARKKTSQKPLTRRVALVAGATRGAGRGIARALAEAGATVYCTGRSVKGNASPYGRPETIDETAAIINDAGGAAIPVRVDHTRENEVKALFRRIMRAHKRIDVVVDSVAGEDPLMGMYGFLWQADLANADAIFRQGLTSRIITAKHAALAMMTAKRGLILEVTENDMIGGGGNPMAQAVKMAQKVLPLHWAAELAPHGVTVMAITPGFLRSESMLDHLDVNEDNWPEAGKKDPNFLQSESPLFVGRAVAALAADPKVRERTGMLVSSWELAREYGFTDYDGRRPDWGRHKIDFSVLPSTWVDLFRTGTDLQSKWLTTLAGRTKKFKAKIP